MHSTDRFSIRDCTAPCSYSARHAVTSSHQGRVFQFRVFGWDLDDWMSSHSEGLSPGSGSLEKTWAAFEGRNKGHAQSSEINIPNRDVWLLSGLKPRRVRGRMKTVAKEIHEDGPAHVQSRRHSTAARRGSKAEMVSELVWGLKCWFISPLRDVFCRRPDITTLIVRSRLLILKPLDRLVAAGPDACWRRTDLQPPRGNCSLERR
ncbi:hypothetical protein SRHO_G00000230 [Serrasalmus rhombeus]